MVPSSKSQTTMSNNPATTLSVSPGWRVQFLRVLQVIGHGATGTGLAALTGLLPIMPASVGIWVALIGQGLAASKPLCQFVGDLIDDGKVDGSFRLDCIAWILTPIMAIGMAAGMTSCAALKSAASNAGTWVVGVKILPPDAEGCYMLTDTVNGKTYSAGPCVGKDGLIDRYRADWRNSASIELRSTYTIATKATAVEYSTDGKTWIGWNSKSGISLDGAPASAHIDAVPK